MLKKYSEPEFSLALFENPPKWYRGKPFWAWNCKITEEKISRDIQAFKEMGFGGGEIHSRAGLATEYLSDEFMALVMHANELMKQNDMHCWLYDEDRWPSGGAGGRIATPQNKSRCLYFAPYGEANAFLPDKQRFDQAQTDGSDPDGYFLARYEVLLEDGYLARYERTERTAPTFGGVLWDAYLKMERADIWYSGFGYVDTLNPRVIQEFIADTYERYYEVCGAEFGENMPAIFTDEPQFAYKQCLALPDDRKGIHLAYTDDFDDSYKAAYGASILDKMPELVWEFKDSVSVWRYHYHNHVSDRFADAFFRQIGGWCGEHGILFTGHAVEEATLASQTRAIGEAMRCYQHLHIPGIDMLCDNREYTTAKQAQSVSRQYGREGVVSELYGVTNWSFTFRGHKLQGDWQAAMGVTHRIPHLSWMSMAGPAKRDYPASIFHQSPWYRAYREIEDYFSRVNTAMLAGKGLAAVAVIHPIESYWLHWGPTRQTQLVRERMEREFSDLAQWLSFGLIDFDYVSEALLPELYQPDGDAFTVGEMRYSTVIVPACHTLRATTLDALERYRQSGGRVLFLGEAGAYVDALPSERIHRLAERCELLPFSQDGLISALETERTVDVIELSSGRRGKDMLYQLRAEGERRYLFLCNVTERERQSFWSMTHDEPYYQNCALSMKGHWDVLLLDAHTGETRPVAVSHQQNTTTWLETVYCAGSFLYQLSPASSTVEQPLHFVIPQYAPPSALEVTGCTLDEPNVLLLDIAEYSVDGGAFRAAEEILKIQRLVEKELDFKAVFDQPWADKRSDDRTHSIVFRFNIPSEIESDSVSLALEEPQYAAIRWNGASVSNEPTGWYVDEDIKTVALGGLQCGDNELCIEIQLGPKTYLEPFYLLGDFGVSVKGHQARITQPDRAMTFGDVVPQGLSFYGGNVRYRCAVDVAAGRYALDIHNFACPVIGVQLDGVAVGNIYAAPYLLELELSAGVHEIELIVYGNRYNTFGPLHNSNKDYDWYGPNAWETDGVSWSLEYNFQPFGILTAPRLRRVVVG